jgi:hypothetical protein
LRALDAYTGRVLRGLVRSCSLLIVGLWVAGAGSAGAQPTDAVQLDLPDCGGVSGAEVRRLVALELAPRPVLKPDSLAPATTQGRLECTPEGARITVSGVVSDPPLRLEVGLTELAPAARPRLLALALAELIATSRHEHSQPPTAAEPAARPTRISLHVWLALGAVRAAEPAVLSPALGVGAALRLDWFALAADLRVDRGERETSPAQVVLETLSLGGAPSWRAGGRSWQLLLGPGLRAGYARMRGEARRADLEGQTLSGFWLGPCLAASFELAFVHRWAARIGAEAGYVTQTLRGEGDDANALLKLAGPWLSLTVGLSWEAIAPQP